MNPHPKEENKCDDFTDSLDALDVDPRTIDICEVSDKLRQSEKSSEGSKFAQVIG